MIDYYHVLNCKSDSSLEEIRKNYKKLALQFHPDKSDNCDSQEFLLIQEAWNVLSDEEKRREFDAEIKSQYSLSTGAILYDTLKISELSSHPSGDRYCVCRCGEYYYVNNEEVKLVHTFQNLYVPCTGCSLTVQITF